MRFGRPLAAGALLVAAPFLAAAGHASAVVRCGLDEIEASGAGPLRGRRVGLLAHRASVTATGRRALEVLRRSGVDVVRLFAPEHGTESDIEAGEPVPSDPGRGERPAVVTLYGQRTRPSRADIADLDALVVDLQDAGVRFYTYAATMIGCLEAAGESGVALVLLDRPNPLGGRLIEGPLMDPAFAGRFLTTTTPGPLVHGLTLGEMARYVNHRLLRPARLTVVPMRGWTREMTWADTGRPWIAPSPNLRSAEAALAYPGLALLEGTNVSEGRGTDAPFLLLGAPWLAPDRAALEVNAPGFLVEAASFTPRALEGVRSPRYAGVPCRGLRVRVGDGANARPYALGLALLSWLRGEPGFRFLDGGQRLDRLLGTSRVRRALERGEGPDSIERGDAAGIETFRTARRDFLLY